MKKIAILISGSGTNMHNLVRHMQAGKIQAEPVLVLSDRAEAGGIAHAKALGVPTAVVERKSFTSKPDFEAEVIRKIEASKADLICLAGYMKILSPEFVNRFWGRILNIHPSLLPAFPGAHGIRDAFEAKAKETGVTVHFVDTGVDTGPIILQKKLTIAENDNFESLEARVHALEYQTYPEALNKVLSGEIPPPGKTGQGA